MSKFELGKKCKRRLRKVVAGAMLFSAFTGTVVLAATEDGNHNYKFNLGVEKESMTEAYTKTTTTTSGYVDQRRETGSVLQCTICNKYGTQKSSMVVLRGIASKSVSYSGYNVQKGDVLCLKVHNSASSGDAVTVSGQWRP